MRGFTNKIKSKYVIYISDDLEFTYFIMNMHLVKGGILIVINYQ